MLLRNRLRKHFKLKTSSAGRTILILRPIIKAEGTLRTSLTVIRRIPNVGKAREKKAGWEEDITQFANKGRSSMAFSWLHQITLQELGSVG